MKKVLISLYFRWQALLKKPGKLLWKTPAGLAALDLLHRSPLLLAIYTCFNRSFYLEQKGVLAGKIAYQRDLLYADRAPEFMLRRNIHRLEKGLTMKPLRPVFATSYIEETVDALVQLVKKQSAGSCSSEARSTDTIQWSVDVLDQYFGVVKDAPAVCASRKKFEGLMNGSLVRPTDRYPYLRELPEVSHVDFDDLMRLAWQRRSVRWFEQRPVPHELIDKAMEVAKLSPSACNRQPFVYRICDAPELRKKVLGLSIGVSGYSENVPCIVALTGQLKAYAHERDRHLIYIDGSLSAMAFLFALETLGIGSCCINWPSIPENDIAIEKILNLEPHERVIMLIAVGFPAKDGMVAYSGKKSLEEIRIYN